MGQYRECTRNSGGIRPNPQPRLFEKAADRRAGLEQDRLRIGGGPEFVEFGTLSRPVLESSTDGDSNLPFSAFHPAARSHIQAA